MPRTIKDSKGFHYRHSLINLGSKLLIFKIVVYSVHYLAVNIFLIISVHPCTMLLHMDIWTSQNCWSKMRPLLISKTTMEMIPMIWLWHLVTQKQHISCKAIRISTITCKPNKVSNSKSFNQDFHQILRILDYQTNGR